MRKETLSNLRLVQLNTKRIGNHKSIKEDRITLLQAQTKCVRQTHRCTALNDLMVEFHFMVNEAIRLGDQNNITSKLTLRNAVYKQFKNQFHTSYISMAVFKAHALLKSYRKNKRKNSHTRLPRIKPDNRFLIVDKQAYGIIYNHIRISTRPHHFVTIPLNNYVMKKISQIDIKLGAVTITSDKLIISYSKDVEDQRPSGYIGVDMNLDNITCCDFDGRIRVFDISYLTKMRQTYRRIKSNLKRNDHRIRKKLYQKYGEKEREKTKSFLHRISKEMASQNNTIFLEKLTGIRKLYRRGNHQRRRFRFKMNSWPRYKLQQQIEYKSNWNGNSVYFVNPQGTSSRCAACEAKILEEHRMIRCPQCGLHIDRDVNAARNILARGLVKHPQDARFEPDAPQVEAMNQLKDGKQIVASLIMGGASHQP